METLILPLGIAVVALVVLRLGLTTVLSWRQHLQQSEQDRHNAQWMSDRIEAANKQQRQSVLAWNGYRKFVVQEKSAETADVCSLTLVPHDHKPLPPFQPGQYLTFRLSVPGREKQVIRCYSLSDAYKDDAYRITIKRVAAPADSPSAPPGLISNYFHERVKVGDILDVQAPRGHFYLNPSGERPAVLIAGGVGVTPLLCMASSVAQQKTGRELMFFYGVRNGDEHAFKEHLEKLAQQHANIRLVVCYSRPGQQDEEGEGRDYHHSGWVTLDLVRSYLQSTNYEFYLCGPPPMMETLTDQLARWGVARQDIHTEAFGPATISKAFGHSHAASDAEGEPSTQGCQVTFAKSGKTCPWRGEDENLLEFALANDVSIESGCRAGNCGTCVVAIKEGEVSYLTEQGIPLEEGTCLACIAAPSGNLVLDA